MTEVLRIAPDVQPFLVHNYLRHYEIPIFNYCEPQPEEDQQQTPCEEFINVVHGVLRVSSRPESPQTTSEPKQKIPVTVIDGSTGTKVPLIIRSTDTIGKLKQAFVKKKPHMKGSLNLALNGKNCLSEMTMKELNVKPGAIFITFQRCTGG